MVDFVPEEYFASTGVSTSFMTGVVALTLPHTDIVFASLDFLRIILTQGTPSGKGATHPMQQIFTTSGQELLKSLLTGMSGDFPEEAISAVILLFRCIADSWPTEMIEWLPGSIESMPLPLEEKTKFVTSCRK
jgi:transportin-3